MTDLHYLALSTALAWVMLLTASLMRVRAWTWSGIIMAFGNRDDVPEPAPAAGRADRAARNMLENLVLFTALVAAARLEGGSGELLTLGAAIFFWSRVVYFGVYLAGIRWLRTAIWGVSLVGLGLIAARVFSR